MKKFFSIFILILVLSMTLLNGCFPGTGTFEPQRPAGFFTGIWHGWIAPISLIFGFFDRNVRIYEQFNTGWWYDFGYYMAVISGFGGIALSRKNKNRNRE